MEHHNTELILNEEGRIYHLDIKPGEVAENIILVGDPARVSFISALFSSVEVRRHKREFITHTGRYKGMRISVISTGIGTGNIDIVLNELDAVFNIDFSTRGVKQKHTSLRIVRIGTSGALQAETEPGTPILSRYCIGLDNVLNFYPYKNTDEEKELIEKLLSHIHNEIPFYLFKADEYLLELFGNSYKQGITAVAPGFYAPQGREIRLGIKHKNFVEHLSSFSHNNYSITNLEMEASAVYGLCKILGHRCCAIDLILANRITKKFLPKHDEHMRHLAMEVLDKLVE